MISISTIKLAEADSWKKRAPLLGLGLMFLWAIGLACFHQWIDARPVMPQILGWAGYLIVTVTCMGLYSYMNFLENFSQELFHEIRVLNEVLEEERARIHANN